MIGKTIINDRNKLKFGGIDSERAVEKNKNNKQ